MKRKKLWALLIIPLIASVMGMVGVASAEAPMVSIDPPGTYWISPPYYDRCTKEDISCQFTIDIRVDGVSKEDLLLAYQFELLYNSEVLKGVSYDLTDGMIFLGSQGAAPVLPAPGHGFEDGKLWLTGAAIFDMGPGAIERLPYGSSIVATVTFEVLAYGYSEIKLGPNTGLIDFYGQWIAHGEPMGHSEFDNTIPGPRLYFFGYARKWCLKVGETQQLKAIVFNIRAEKGAWVKMKFMVFSDIYPTEEYWTDEAWVDAGKFKGVSLSTEFVPPGPGKFYGKAYLYFKTEDPTMTDFVPYDKCVSKVLGGWGISFIRYRVREEWVWPWPWWR